MIRLIELLVIVACADDVSAHFGLSDRDVILKFSSAQDVRRQTAPSLSDAHDNSMKRRRTTLVIDDVIVDPLDVGKSSMWTASSKAAEGVSNDSVVATTSADGKAASGPRGGAISTESVTVNVCQRLNLTSNWAQRVCSNRKGVTSFGDTLLDSIRLSVSECRLLFLFDRWNCSIDNDRHRVQTLDRGLRESAILHAMSSAALVHTTARACSRGQLKSCSCDRDTNSLGVPDDVNSAWNWGGCSDNIKYASRAAWRIISPRQRRQNDNVGPRSSTTASLLHRIDDHNYDVGITVVKRGMQTICKCTGLSVSCTSRICWRQLSTFRNVSNQLRTAYDRAIAVSVHDPPTYDERSSSATGSLPFGRGRSTDVPPVTTTAPSRPVRSRSQPDSSRRLASSQTLVYFAPSPNFCSASAYSPGTRGRVCRTASGVSADYYPVPTSPSKVDRQFQRTMTMRTAYLPTAGPNRCDEQLCCGRGVNVRQVTVWRRCNCRVVHRILDDGVVFCCDVKCDVCASKEEIYTCK